MQRDFGIEIVREPFALDGYWPPSVDDKVNLVPALVSPIEYFPALRASHNFIHYEMLPYRPKVIIPQVLPATVVTNEAGIEAIDFRRGDYLCGPASAISTKAGRRRSKSSKLLNMCADTRIPFPLAETMIFFSARA